MVYFFMPQRYHMVKCLAWNFWSSSGHVKGAFCFCGLLMGLLFLVPCVQASVGLVISLLLLVDLSLTLLMLLQFYSISLAAMLAILLVLPFASVFPSAAGLNALFSHGPRRSAALARVYALWNMTSVVNLVCTLSLLS